MNNSSISQEDIRDFLKGRMSDTEAAAFREQMSKDPVLEDQVAFVQLMMSGLENLEQKHTGKNSRKLWLIIIGLLVLISGVLIYRFGINDEPTLPVPDPTVVLIPNKPNAVAQGGSPSPLADSDRPVSLCWNSRGEVVIGGQFEGSPVFGDIRLQGFGGKDIFLMNCNQQLEFQWARQFGSALADDNISEIAADSRDNILITGGIYDQAQFGDQIIRTIGHSNIGPADFFVAKLNAVGQLIWIDHNGGNMTPDKQTGDNLGVTVATDNVDNIITAGIYIGSPKMGNQRLPEGGPNDDIYIAKYSPDGTLTWVKTITSDYQLMIRDLAVDKQNDFYITGRFGHHNLSGNAYFDEDTLSSSGGQDIFIAKYTSEGKLVWTAKAGSKQLNGHDGGNCLAIDDQGNVILTGFFESVAQFGDKRIKSKGQRDFFLAKYDPSGKVIWAKSFGGSENDSGNRLCLDKKGNIYCTGKFSGTAQFDQFSLKSNGSEDMVILKCDPDGNIQWIRQAGGNSIEKSSDNVSGITINNNKLVITGFFSGIIQFGNQTLNSVGREDIFVLFLDTQGHILEARRTNYVL